jgi:16S rRNA (guanine527-N7)-methyltransferase
MSGSELDVLADGAAGWGLELRSIQLDQFGRYLSLLRTWNQRLNLTAVDDIEEIQTRHFLDSLSCALVTGDLSGRKLVDVGSGAGFPGLPLKLLYPDLQLTLVESVAKKARFLQVVVDELNLKQVTVVVERAEVLGQQPKYRESYDWAVARAVAPLATLAEYLLPFCRLDGHMLALKGRSAAQELETATEALAILGGLSIPVTSAEAKGFVIVKKISPTPANYPRRTGVPAKRPL